MKKQKGLAVAESAAPRAYDRVAREQSGRLLAAPAAALYTGWPYRTLMNAAKDGHIPIVRIPGSDRAWFDRKDLDRAIEAWKERLG